MATIWELESNFKEKGRALSTNQRQKEICLSFLALCEVGNKLSCRMKVALLRYTTTEGIRKTNQKKQLDSVAERLGRLTRNPEFAVDSQVPL